MGYRVTTPVWDYSQAKGGDLLVLLAIADSADNTTGDAYPSIKTLIELSRLSERGVQYSIRNLIEMGELSVFQRDHHKTNKYHVVLFDGLVFDERGAKIAPQKAESGVQRAAPLEDFRGAKIAPQKAESGVQSATVRGAICDSQGCNLRQSGVQSATNAIYDRARYQEPVLKLPVLKQPVLKRTVRAREEELDCVAGENAEERFVPNVLGENAFQEFKRVYPLIGGKFLNEDLARKEFFRFGAQASWHMIIRGGDNYARSSIVQRAREDGDRGIKFANNFIRDGTWKDWQEPDVVASGEEIMSRRVKKELTRLLIESPENIPPVISDDAKRLFYSLKTHWRFLAKMASDGKDICGPQTIGVDVKMLAAEGGYAKNED